MDDSINNVTPILLATILNDTSWPNTTDDVIKPTNSAEIQLRLYDIFIPILGIVIILLNLAVVVSSGLILKKGQQPRSTYLFLGNVALTDLLTGIAVLFGQFYPRAHRGEISCAMQIGMIVSATITSVYSLGLIAVDRYLYIVYGLQYQRYIYPTRARIMIIITWIIGIVIGFLPAMGWRGDTKNGKICWFIIIAPPELVILTTSIGVLPLLLIITLYSIILYYALRKVVQLKQAAERQDGFVAEGNLRIFTGGRSYTVNQANTNNSNNAAIEESEKPLQRRRWTRFFTRNKKSNENVRLNTGKSPSKWKAIKVVLFTTGSFVVTWVPYFIACVWYVSCNPETTPDLCNRLRIAIAAPLAILGFANSLINPIIYAWWHNGFRESVRRIYFKTKRKPRTDATASTSVGSSSGGGGGRGSSAGGIATTGINEQSDTETLDNSESEINPNIKQRRLTINDAVIVKDTSPNDGEIVDGTVNTNGTKNNTSLTNEQQNN